MSDPRYERRKAQAEALARAGWTHFGPLTSGTTSWRAPGDDGEGPIYSVATAHRELLTRLAVAVEADRSDSVLSRVRREWLEAEAVRSEAPAPSVDGGLDPWDEDPPSRALDGAVLPSSSVSADVVGPEAADPRSEPETATAVVESDPWDE